MWPHRRQPTRLPCPWDSPGKNTGMGCHFLLQCMKVKVKSLRRVRLLVTPCTVAHQAPPSMGFSREEYWSGVPLPSSENLWAKHKMLSVHFSSVQSLSHVRLCDPIDGSPPGSAVPGILQARTLEWFAISFSNAGKWKVKVKSLSRVRPSATPWTSAYQAPPSMGFSRPGVLEWGAIAFSSLRVLFVFLCAITRSCVMLICAEDYYSSNFSVYAFTEG